MKVLIAAAYYHPRVGGLENYAAAIAQGLRERGWDVVVVCGDSRVKMVTRDELDGYTVWRLPIWKVAYNTPVHPGWLCLIRRIVRVERPDVVNAHTPVPYMADVVTLAAGQIPVVITYHAATLVKPGGFARWAVTRGYQAIESITLARTNGIIAVSPYVKDALGARLAPKTQVITNAVASVSGPRHAAGTGLVFVANLEPSHAWKGLDLILCSLAIARERYDVTPLLTIVGDGADKPRYEQRVKDLRLEESVRFTGLVTGSARDQIMRQAAAQLVYPSTANDGMPTVLLEGWAQGLPVIGSDIGSISTIVKNGQNGVLVAPNDPAALAAGICGFLAHSQEAQAMGESGRRLVELEYTWPRQVERTAQFLERVTQDVSTSARWWAVMTRVGQSMRGHLKREPSRTRHLYASVSELYRSQRRRISSSYSVSRSSRILCTSLLQA
jgi:glycosyltransferase involved in cell wall biosynthesis